MFPLSFQPFIKTESPIPTTENACRATTIPTTVLYRFVQLPRSFPLIMISSKLRVLPLVGAYRLCTDESLYKPIWNRSQQSLKRALLLCIPLLILSYFPTSFYTKYILSRSPFSPKDLHSSALLGVSPLQYTTWMLLFGQITFVIEWLLKKQLKKSRTEVYDRTVQSRGKRTSSAYFFQPYKRRNR